MRRIDAATAWFRRHPPWIADGLLALCVWYAEYTTVGVLTTTDLLGPVEASPLVILIIVFVGTAPLTFRRMAPKSTLVATGAVSLVEAFLLIPTTGLGLLIALYTVASLCPRRETVGMLGVMLVGTFAAVVQLGAPEYGLSNVVVFVVAVALGDRTRVARARADALEERARELEREREERERLVVTAERARIARELHDVAAHGVAVIAVQAAGARRVLHTDPDRAAEALREIEHTARDSLGEIRQAVALLRDGAQDAAPQPGLADLPSLITRFRDAGLDVTALLPDADADMTAAVSLTVFRVVQEALTNTLRHAGRTRAHVRVSVRPGTVRVVIADEGPVDAADPVDVDPPAAGRAGAHGGYGLAGLRERVRSHGGTLTVHRRADGYLVDARIPTADNAVPASASSAAVVSTDHQTTA